MFQIRSGRAQFLRFLIVPGEDLVDFLAREWQRSGRGFDAFRLINLRRAPTFGARRTSDWAGEVRNAHAVCKSNIQNEQGPPVLSEL